MIVKAVTSLDMIQIIHCYKALSYLLSTSIGTTQVSPECSSPL